MAHTKKPSEKFRQGIEQMSIPDRRSLYKRDGAYRQMLANDTLALLGKLPKD